MMDNCTCATTQPHMVSLLNAHGILVKILMAEILGTAVLSLHPHQMSQPWDWYPFSC